MRHLARKLRYNVLRPLASLLPEPVLRWLDRRWRICEDDADGWTFWTDASYHRYVRHDKHKPCPICGLPKGRCPVTWGDFS